MDFAIAYSKYIAILSLMRNGMAKAVFVTLVLMLLASIAYVQDSLPIINAINATISLILRW